MFFFFKQKTAYEMRISDWSSDVCSSDLMTGDLVKAMRACPQPIVAALDGVCVGAGAIVAMASDIRLATPETKTAFLFTRVGLAGCDMGEIGRASCRERVCQYG